MSGHSKWAQIKRKKEVTDKKKGQVFGRLAREIVSASKAGSNPATNTALRDSIARARAANMPQTNIDRLLNRAGNQHLKEVVYEGFGPDGVALLIVALTDNTNRTVQEIRSMLKDHGASLAAPGAARWKFKDGQPIQPRTLSPQAQEQLQLLLTQLREHPDIADIATEAVE